MAIGNSAGPLAEVPTSFELERRHFRSQLFRLGGNSITVRDVTPRNRRDPFTGNDYTDEIQRIRRRNCHHLTGRRHFSRGPQRLECTRHGELFTEEPIYESAAANFTPSFKPPECQL